MSDNWVVQNLENALETWNDKLSEIWQLLTTTPQNFKGGSIWNVMVTINGAVQAIGLALLVLFFVVGVVRTCGSFTDVKKPEHALKLFVRFAIAKGVITYGLELMLALFNIIQGVISTILTSSGFGTPDQTTLPAEMVTTIEDCGFFESIPLWAVTLIGGLFITVLSFIMIMTVYGRFFKLYMYTAIAPIPLSTFAGEPTQNVGKSFKSVNELALKLFEKGYDVRFQTTQTIPVFINEIVVRMLYSIRRLIKYYITVPSEDRCWGELWKSCEPFSNATVKRMLTVAHTRTGKCERTVSTDDCKGEYEHVKNEG